jgi:hypothetical protein
MILHEDSHTDHVSPDVLNFVLEKFKDRDGFFAEVIELPEGLTAECGLYGPIMGDPPVPEEEVSYLVRAGRMWRTRMVDRPKRQVKTVTVIGGSYQEHPCVLWTVYGGPLAPQELNDPALKDEDREKSRKFWSEHALNLGL